MGYDWSGASEGGGESQKIPDGYHRLRICKIVDCKSDGSPFRSLKGDPQIMVVCENPDGAEAAQMFTLSDKAAWTMARLLSRCGIDLDELSAQGIEPVHFADRQFAASRLIGLEFWGYVEWGDANNGKSYSSIMPHHESEKTTEIKGLPRFKKASAADRDTITDDDIPF